MKKTKTKKNKAMDEKVTMSVFFTVQWKILRELYEKYKLETTAIIIIACATVSANYIDLKLLEYATNSVSEHMDTGGDFTQIAVNIGLFLAALLLMRLLQNVYNIIREKYISKITLEAEMKIVNKLSAIPYEYYENNIFHEKINLACKAGEQYPSAVFGVTEIARIILMLIVYGVMLSKINILYVAVIFIVIALSVAVAANVTDKQLDYYRTRVWPEGRKEKYFKNVLSGRVNHQNIQTLRCYTYFAEKYGYYNNRERKNYLRLNLLSFSTELASSLLFGAVYFVTAVILGNGVASGTYELGYYSMVVALLANLFQTIKQFSLFMLNRNWYVKVLSTYYEILELEEPLRAENSSSEFALELRNVKYRYPQAEANALNSVSVKFNMGEKIAIVGHNGSGKTTLISTILSLLKINEGNYTSSGMIKTAIMQEFGQYQMTVRENIEIGCGGEQLTDDEITEILKKVDMYDFIASKPDGVNTRLGQLGEGAELSKGQWQRLAIGRLLAKKEANVWVLDEPTAYLDPLAEIDMYKFIFDLAGDRLVFFISHRLGFAKNADKIIVVNQGSIAESGTHRKLMETSGSLYAQMFEAQKEWYA